MEKREVQYGKRKTNNVTIALYDGDFDLLKYIAERIGCSRGEAMRTALRAYAAQLERVLGA